MGPPTMLQHVRQVLGRAVRETGQALDRVAIKMASLAVTKHSFYDDPVIYEDFLSRHRHQFPLVWSGKPVVHPKVAYVAPCSTLIGSVNIGPGSSVWYGAVLRADECLNAESFNKNDDEESGEVWELSESRFRDRLDHHGGGIFIGENSNIQDNCIITSRVDHCRIGDGVTIGHCSQIHSAKVGDYSLIGMGSILLEGAVVESEAFVAAGAVVGSGQVVKAGELWVGNPARKLRDLTAEQRENLRYQSSEYVNVATTHQDVMLLGGNLTESMLEEPPELEKSSSEIGQEQQQSEQGSSVQEEAEEELKVSSGR